MTTRTQETEPAQNIVHLYSGKNDVPDCLDNQIVPQKSETIGINFLPTKIVVQNQFGPLGAVRDYFKVNLANKHPQEQPPVHFTEPRVFLGARVVEHHIARWVGIRHLYIKIYEYPSKYLSIESLPFFSNSRWLSGVWIKENHWETRGIEWELIPDSYENLIGGLKHATQVYHDAQIPYNYKKGPNSNSFIGWALYQCGLDISKILSGLTYWGIDYWRFHPIHSYTTRLLKDDAGCIEISA